MNARFFVAAPALVLVLALCWGAVLLHEWSLRRDRRDPAE